MTNRFQLAAIAAGMMMVGSAAQAQQNVCQANVAQVLSEYGVNLSDVTNPTWQTQRWARQTGQCTAINSPDSLPPARAAVFTFR